MDVEQNDKLIREKTKTDKSVFFINIVADMVINIVLKKTNIVEMGVVCTDTSHTCFFINTTRLLHHQRYVSLQSVSFSL